MCLNLTETIRTTAGHGHYGHRSDKNGALKTKLHWIPGTHTLTPSETPCSAETPHNDPHSPGNVEGAVSFHITTLNTTHQRGSIQGKNSRFR